MKKYILLIIGGLIVILIVYQRNKILSPYLTSANFRESDTIKPVFDYSFNTKCFGQFEGYFYRFGYFISNYYTVCDYCGLGSDTIAVLSPKILTPEASSCRNENENIINGRIIVIGGIKRKAVYKNVIENNIGAGTCGGEFVKLTFSGFKLNREIGQSCKFSYEINVNYLANDYYITEINLESHCPSDEVPKRANVKYKNIEFNLSDYNRNLIDSLRNVYAM